MDISKMIKVAVSERKAKRITQSQMARNLGISRANLWRYENERLQIPLEVFCDYCELLGFELVINLKI